MELTQEERNHILFYKGAVDDIHDSQGDFVLREFYSIENAYEAVNTLLFPGMQNERIRMSAEKRKIDPMILNYMKEMLQIYCSIYRVMCRYTYEKETRTEIHTYRKDRENTLQFLEGGKTPCFFSTSFCNIMNPYFLKRKSGILLLEIRTDGKVEHLDMNDLLGENIKYADEKEILYAPFLPAKIIKKLELSSEEQKLRDCEDQKPVGKYFIELQGFNPCKGSVQELEQECEILKKDILDKGNLENAKHVWTVLQNDCFLEDEAEKQYCRWKDVLQQYLKCRFSLIKKRVLLDFKRGGGGR